MSKPITGHLTIQPVREGRFELRDADGVTVGTFQHEDHAKALADAYNDDQRAKSIIMPNLIGHPALTFDVEFKKPLDG